MTRFTPQEVELLVDILKRELTCKVQSLHHFKSHEMASPEYYKAVVSVFDKEIVLVGSMIDKLEN